MGEHIPDPINDIERLIYWWRRYEGRRHPEHGKVWLSHDITELQIRILQYLKTPSKFNWDMGVVEEKNEGDEK